MCKSLPAGQQPAGVSSGPRPARRSLLHKSFLFLAIRQHLKRLNVGGADPRRPPYRPEQVELAL